MFPVLDHYSMGLLQKRKTRFQTRLKIVLSRLTPDGGGVLNKCLYGEAPPPPRANPLPFYTPFFTKKVPLSAFVYLLLTNGAPFTYLV